MILFAYYFSKLANEGNMYKLSAIIITCRMANYFIAYVFQPENTVPVILYLFTEESLQTLHGIVDAIIINYFPVTALSGMMITMLNSMKNVGHNFTFHLMVVNSIGHRAASLIGFIGHALFMIFAYRRMI